MSEAAYAYVSLIPVAENFQKKIAKQLGGTAGVGKTSGKKAGDNFSGGFGSQVKKLGLIAGAALAAAGLGKFFKDSITQASDLGESINAVQKAYLDYAGDVLKLGDGVAERLGLSTVDFNAAAVRFSAFAERVVGKGGDVAGFVDDITTRASDFASVFNIEVSEALQVFQSGLSGEAEPLKRFGINLLDTEVKAYALENGLIAVGDTMSEGIKTQARFGLIMQETSKTAGDFADTSDGLANGQRILKAGFENTQAVIGDALLPVVIDLMNVIKNQLLPVMVDFGDWLHSPAGEAAVKAFSDAILGTVQFVIDLVGAIVTALPVLALMGAAFAILRAKVILAHTAIAIMTVRQIGLNAAMAANPIGLLVTALALLVVGLAAYINSTKDAVPTQEELNDRLRAGSVALTGFEEDLAEGIITEAQYEMATKAVKEELRETRIALEASHDWTQKQKNASLDARDAALRQKYGIEQVTSAIDKAEAINTGYTDSLDNYLAKSALYRGTSDNLAEGLGNVAKQAALAALGISELSLVDQARAITQENIERIQLYGGKASDAPSFMSVLKNLKANQQFGIGLFDISQEEIDELGRKLGYSVGATNNVTSATNAATGAMQGLGDAVAETNQAFADAQNVQDGYSNYGVPNLINKVGGGQFDVGKLTDSLNSLNKAGYKNVSAAAFGGSVQQALDKLTGQSTYVNAKTGMQTTVSGNLSEEALAKVLGPGFTALPKLDKSVGQLTDAIDGLNSQVSDKGLTPFAAGGLVTRPTAALIGEAGPEVVIPLNKFESFMETNGRGKAVNYYAAPNQSIDSEQELFQAMRRAKVVAGW